MWIYISTPPLPHTPPWSSVSLVQPRNNFISSVQLLLVTSTEMREAVSQVKHTDGEQVQISHEKTLWRDTLV
jgi:hypothetical protein